MEFLKSMLWGKAMNSRHATEIIHTFFFFKGWAWKNRRTRTDSKYSSSLLRNCNIFLTPFWKCGIPESFITVFPTLLLSQCIWCLFCEEYTRKTNFLFLHTFACNIRPASSFRLQKQREIKQSGAQQSERTRQGLPGLWPPLTTVTEVELSALRPWSSTTAIYLF